MLFNSHIFIFVFLPIVLIVFCSLNRFKLIKLAQVWLVISSLVFYAYWNIAYLLLLLISAIFNYQMGKAIANSQPQSKSAKTLLWVGISLNLIVIGYYKYFYFFISSINHIIQSNFSINEIILPLAISFYTFTQIAYLVDAYRGETKALNYDILTYTLFVIFFPQLIAGPILRHDQLIPQFRRLKTYIFSHQNLSKGIVLFSLGLSKKVLIADNLSPWVTTIFNHPTNLTFIESWVGALSYSFQLYFDFSGYSDMAIALGLMFNITLPINFDSPYKATSIREFWQRWHITLSNFLRDYLYIPLGGNRNGELRHYANLILTMLLGGLWHGAGWTYVIWGGLHGFYLSINHGWRKLNIPLPSLISWLITSLAIIGGWVLFRADSLSNGLAILKTMIGFNGIILPREIMDDIITPNPLNFPTQSWGYFPYLPKILESHLFPFVALFLIALSVKYLPNSSQILSRFKPHFWWATGVGILAGFCLLSLSGVSEFLYFQF